tara:strand:- start:2570 stop:3232 length:663 start_codon:yes stop_codon:yes gene_type:complete
MLELDGLNDHLQSLDAIDRIRLVYDLGLTTVGTTSGGDTSAVTLHLAKLAVPETKIPFLFVDTGFYDAETYRLIERFEERYKKPEDREYDIRVYTSNVSRARVEALYGRIWEDSATLARFNEMVKHAPLNEAFEELDVEVWIRGIMRWETPERSEADFIELRNGVYRVHPILDWSEDKVGKYMDRYDLPRNPGHDDPTKGPNRNLECKLDEAGRKPVYRI